ncbi:MAG: hypothetical protein HFE51_10850 [Clostridia bacterium]|nr:hypothetical protein [Clostridia bacterium]
MKKLLIIMLTAIMLLSVSGCGNTAPNKPTATETPSIKTMTAEEICNLLKENNTNVNTITVFDAETDPNELLGRPNGYTSKVDFEDIRVEQIDDELKSFDGEVSGGSIEVFANNKSAKSRADYINSIAETVPMFAEYNYVYDNVVLRLDKSLTPEQAQEYADILAQYK